MIKWNGYENNKLSTVKEATALNIAALWKGWSAVHSVKLATLNLKQGFSFDISAAFSWHHCPYSLYSIYIQF